MRQIKKPAGGWSPGRGRGLAKRGAVRKSVIATLRGGVRNQLLFRREVELGKGLLIKIIKRDENHDIIPP